ncbi:MAG: FixH family protein [Rhodospirillales bacterium]|nr:FixH family protein [Rhodospirillales bacterium]
MRRARADGWWYPWIFVLGMLVVIAVNIVLITSAIDTFPGLDTEDAYQKGLAYNQTIAAARAQEARGWQADVRYAPRADAASAAGREAAGHEGELVVTLRDKAGEPLYGLDVDAALIRPTRSGLDTRVSLQPAGNGEYRGEAILPLPGQWDVRVFARRGNEDFQATRRIMVQ